MIRKARGGKRIRGGEGDQLCMNGIIEVSTSRNADQTRHLVFLISFANKQGKGAG